MNDSKIIEMYFLRDSDAVKLTSQMYGGKLQRFAQRMLGSKEDAEECVNDTLMRAWDTIPPNKPDNLQAYLMTLCRNIALNTIDWKEAKKRKAELVTLTSELENCISDKSGKDVEDSKALGELLNTFLKQLPDDKRNMFIRRYWYSDSIASIANRFDCSQSKVKVVLFRTRKELKKYLKKEGVVL